MRIQKTFVLILAATLMASSAMANIVVNGGFEAGSFTPGWTQSGVVDGFTFVTDYYPHSGQYHAEMGALGGLNFITQSLPTVIGQTYTLDLWLAHNVNEDADIEANNSEFLVMWNGGTLTDQVNLGGFDYTHISFGGLVATSASTDLVFGSREDSSFFSLDDVAVNCAETGVPEPATFLLMGGGLIAVAAFRRRRAR